MSRALGDWRLRVVRQPEMSRQVVAVGAGANMYLIGRFEIAGMILRVLGMALGACGAVFRADQTSIWSLVR